jgi:tetratricopeptide (TPR) repeat protein
MGRPADAIPWLEKALQIWEKAVGTESPERVYALSSLADAHSMLGHHDAAIEYAEDGLALVDRHETEVSQRGDMRFVAAKVLGRAGRSRPRALELARLAQADFARSERPAVEELEALTRWLRDNG